MSAVKVTHEHAVEVDTALAALYDERHKLVVDIGRAADTVHRIANDERQGHRFGSGPWKLSYAEAKAAAEERARPWDHLDRILSDIAAANDRILEILDEEKPLQADFAEHRWPRFFLVTSSKGHVHSSLNCATCYPQTTYAWLPTLSGLDMAAAVEQEGEILCSICFPDAPVAWTEGVSKATLEERAARDVAKAEREAKKLAKALLPDGSEYTARYGERAYDTVRIKTLHSAKMWLTDAASWNRRGEHPSYPAWVAQEVAEAIAAKTGDTVDEILAAADKRARKRDGV
ncbi:MAG TPA: hypothetical protein VMX12_12695 [Acidimicrobiia bacterium]|nr:hypothetical protein [Acidimicrobiia bacterium]